MKKIALIGALALVASGMFAQAGGMMGPGPGRGPAIDWKIGTVVTTEYKKVSGTVSIGQTLAPTFKADGVDYPLWLPRTAELAALKNGDTVTIEGTFTTVKSDTKVAPTMRPFKITVAGKEIDLSTVMGGRGGRMDDRDGNDNPFGPGVGGGKGNGPRN
jgi:hypothetical protein